MNKVLHINGGGDLGGGKSHLVTLLPGLRRLGCDAELLVFSEGVLARECEAAGVPVHRLNKNWLVSPGLVVALRQFLLRHEPALIHTHGGRATFYGRLAAASSGHLCVVTTVHSHPRLDHEERWKVSVFSLADRLTRGATRQFIAVSSPIATELRGQGVAARQIVIIPNGIDEWPAVGQALVAREGTLVCSIGRFTHIKGFDVLLQAMALLSSRGLRFRLVLIGDGPDATALRELAERLAIADRVDFMGYVHNARGMLADADLLVLASRSEGQPIVLLEAMAAGVPVVSTAVGGVPEIVKDGDTGLLVPAEDPEALADAMQRVIQDPELAQRLRSNGRHWYEEHGTGEKMVRETLRCYEELGYVCR
ncbi:MAG TPA: glycosyltransferase [Bacillota bacterium]|nr:glycosyltransferase [Bacillota bacterium]